MEKLNNMLKDIEIPSVTRVIQKFDDTLLEDPCRYLVEQMEAKSDTIRPDMRIAITGGSRGIIGYKELMKTIVGFVRDKGAKPFIVPSMGSHGGATAEGQKKILEDMGITEEEMGAPIVSSMDVVQIGMTEVGLPVFIDKNAYEADGIILFNRIKTHTSIRGPHESGLVKMLAIGLAKHKGAEMTHRLGVDNLPDNIIRVGTIGLNKLNVLLGIGTVENGYNGIAEISVLRKDEILEEEKKIIIRARERVPRIFLNEMDVLIVKNFGKNISGSGVDPAVVGRPINNRPNPGPNVRALGALRMTKESHGNCAGIGLLDFIPKDFYEGIHFESLYLNCMTGVQPKLARVAMVLDNELLVVKACLRVCGVPNPRDARLVLIDSTKYLEEIYMSKRALREAEAGKLESKEEYETVKFDNSGRLMMFAH